MPWRLQSNLALQHFYCCCCCIRYSTSQSSSGFTCAVGFLANTTTHPSKLIVRRQTTLGCSRVISDLSPSTITRSYHGVCASIPANLPELRGGAGAVPGEGRRRLSTLNAGGGLVQRRNGGSPLAGNELFVPGPGYPSLSPNAGEPNSRINSTVVLAEWHPVAVLYFDIARERE